ncbi:MAG: diguanylate cyclase [Rhodospirillaceae bacterium]
MTDRRQRILMVDDIAANIKILSAILKHEHDILVATNGADALETALVEQPDVILLDVMMPDMDGYEVCTRLKADPRTREIPVIFISAMNEVEDEARGLEVGGLDYITKPINPAIVKARVRIHLELKRQRDLLQRISMIDGLTGIANRRRFDETLEREWRRCHRAGTPLSLILVDVDFFKNYNDHYGHLAGDECLKKVAVAMADQIRRGSDLVARFGGEEFACLLPDIAAEGAHAMAVRLRDAVSNLRIRHSRSAAADHVTISLGVATQVPDGDDPPSRLIDQADRGLYFAKQNGRNQIALV